MTNDILVDYLKKLNWNVEVIQGTDTLNYIVIRNYLINVGSLVGKICDVAIQQSNAVPFVLSSAIHTKPHLVPMNMQNELRTQNSGISGEWQYWSRTLTKEHTPKNIVAHIASIFSEV